METLIVQPKNKEQLEALKAFMTALKIHFKMDKSSSKKVDFSDLAGKLQWQGDALEEQRKLRSE